ncbi:MAG: tRNA uridine-5-carboxymethylaminomethyl(34) synthesis enzyme MnmG [Deltaproteobacteria bacterium]|nr:tRNA uridine-5-carboxymethylaminomethyl(34) synthesis enzyme MnmG [Deltaproteobacteria bacterium]
MLTTKITYQKKYKVIVVGAGHAGCEAALATARMGLDTLLLTMNLDTIAQMSCNPAIGGLAKGQLVKEIDALGGEMALNTDATGLQFRILNTKKGPAVRASRAQADRSLYHQRMKGVLEQQPLLDIKQGAVERLALVGQRVAGVETREGVVFLGEKVVLTSGTFLRGLIHVGMNNFPGGRAGEPAAMGLSGQLKNLGFEVGRLKTGTPPRLDGKTINYSNLQPQYGDDPPRPFSFLNQTIDGRQLPCFITYTNRQTHELITGGLDRSPLYSGVIEGVGPRYCPSIEDKIVRFPEKDQHQIFLEPEGWNTTEVYPNGLPTSLPVDVQVAFLRTIQGLERVEVVRFGYAIEYDYVDPVQLKPSLETKLIEGLYHAGQINGTSGYEEAAAQGLLAGINAGLACRECAPLVLGRDQAYIGVLIDDLVNLGTNEPYRMFTSRAEYRLLLREDNADQRLTEIGRKVGLVAEDRWRLYVEKVADLNAAEEKLKNIRVGPADKEILARLKIEDLQNGLSGKELLKRPGIDMTDLKVSAVELKAFSEEVLEQLEIAVKYEGYIKRQIEQVERFRKTENVAIPENINYDAISGLTAEVREKLNKVRPLTLGQASRIRGMTPAAMAILSVAIRRV